MSDAWLYAAVTAAVAAVVTAALWRPRSWQWALLLGGPLVSAAAAAASVSGGLGLTVLLVIPYAYLLVPAALPWERAWARWAVPGTVVAGCLALGGTAVASLPVRLVLAAPLAIAVIALVRVAAARTGDRGRGQDHDHNGRSAPEVATPPQRALGIGRVIVAVATLQGVAGLAVVGLGAVVLILEKRHPTTGTWAGLGEVIAAVIAGLGVVLAGTFFGLAAGLRRRYRDFRLAFVVVQGLVAALLLLTGRSSWAVAGVAWMVGTAALALADPGASGASGASGDPAAPVTTT